MNVLPEKIEKQLAAATPPPPLPARTPMAAPRATLHASFVLPKLPNDAR